MKDVDRIVNNKLALVPKKDRKAVSDWILEKRSQGKALNTIRTYLCSITTVSRMIDKPLVKCSKNDLLRLQVAIRDDFDNPVMYCHVLRDLLRVSDREDMINFISLNRNKTKKDYQDPEKVLNRSDVSRMLSVNTDTRDKAILAMLWDCGCRVHELTAIQIEDLQSRKVDSNGKTKRLFSVWFRKQKVAGEERRLPLHESSKYVARWLRAHPDPTNKKAPLFPSRHRKYKGSVAITVNTVRDITALSGKRAKIEKRTNPHGFRHGRATDMKLRGVSDDAIRTWFGWTRFSDMPKRYVSRTEQAQVNEIAIKCGYEDESLEPPAPVEELESDDMLPPFAESESVQDERYAQISKEMGELREASVRNEARFNTLLDRLARHVPSIASDPRVVREQMEHTSWIDNGMEDVDEEEKKFLKDKLEKFERERREYLDQAREQYWKSRGADDEE